MPTSLPPAPLALPKFSHGQHACLIFESPEEQAAVTVPFLAAGLERGERAVYVGDEASVERMRRGLSEAGVDLHQQVRSGSLVLSSERDYLDRGSFNTDKMLSFLQQAYDAAMADGKTALRAAGDVAWEVGPERDFRDIIYYEAMLDIFFLGKKMVGMCQYPKGFCPPEVLGGILKTHKTAAIGREFCSNFHYNPPELLLEKDGRARDEKRVEWMTSQLLRARAAEAERDALQAQLIQSQKMEAIGRLAGSVAHDFNNLLSVILGYGEMLMEGARPGDPGSEAIGEICRAGERASVLTRQLLTFSRKQQLHPQVLDLNTVVEGMEKMLRRLIGEDIDLSVKLSPALGSVRADPGHLDQVLMNLVINARDAMPKGGALTVETANITLDEEYARSHAAAKPGPHVMLAVTDTGEGMDAETLAKIFEPFFTTKQPGKGTGLGLSTVYGIVRQSGGNVWVYSEPGRGSSFKIYLPRVDAAPEAAGAGASGARMARPGTTLLLVEDQQALRTMLVKILKAAGYQVLEAADAEQALELCASHTGEIHLMLTDMVLPGIGGRELAGRIIALRPSLKVAYMSGYTDESVSRQGALGPDSTLIEKPILTAPLLLKLNELLG